jgi:hypothetical protein
MKNLLLTKTIFLLLLIISGKIQAQESVNTTGENITGTNGTMSYTIGQLDYESTENANGSVSQGVQHPYEYFSVGVDDYPLFTLEAVVFPNPTIENIQLSIKDYAIEKLQIQLFDVQGKLLLQQKIENNITPIEMTNYESGSYFLKITETHNTLKTFKIIKN